MLKFVLFFLDSHNMCCCDLLDCGCYASMLTGLNKIQIYKFFKKKKLIILYFIFSFIAGYVFTLSTK